ncbi:MAG TPA: TMEM14 family protein [Blastocatellia bacterium]|nr:TMEM14 family protein [Blastocatellia bacterium]
MASWIVLFYGVLVAVGGIMGYRAGSLASLIAGGVSGLLLAIAAVTMMRGSYMVGWVLALFVTFALLARFGIIAAQKGFKLMPGGMVIIISLVVLAVLFANRGR